MNTLILILALLIPWLASALLLGRCLPTGSENTTATRAMLLAAAYLFAMLITAGLLYASAKLTGGFHFPWIMGAWTLALVIALGLARPWRIIRQIQGPYRPFKPSSFRPQASQWVAGLLLLLIVIRLAGLSVETIHQAMPAWDAWVVWAERAKVWFHTGQLNTFVHGHTWLTGLPADTYTIDAAHYPLAVSLIHLWAALALGEWHEAWVNLPWLGAAIAITSALFAALRSTGAPSWLALLGCWLLASLPIFNAHIALAGYADLWLTLAFTIAALGLMAWMRNRDAASLALALLALLSMPLIKHHAWLLLFASIAPALLWSLTTRMRWIATIALATMLAIGLIGFEGSIPLGSLGTLGIDQAGLTLPGVGLVAPEFERIALSMRQHLFVLDSWHLLWGAGVLGYLLLMIVGWRSRMGQALILTLTSAVVFYSLSYASPRVLPFVIDSTVINRGLLYLAPLLIFAIINSLLLLDEELNRLKRPQHGQDTPC